VVDVVTVDILVSERIDVEAAGVFVAEFSCRAVEEDGMKEADNGLSTWRGSSSMSNT
jgi:hypothetical protein